MPLPAAGSYLSIAREWADGDRGEELANRFAESMLEEVIHKEGVLKLTAKELHSFDSVAAFAALLRHTRKVFALPTP